MDDLNLSPVAFRVHETPTDYIYATFAREGITPQANVLYICSEENARAFSPFPSCGVVIVPVSERERPSVPANVLCEYCVIGPTDTLDLMCRIQERLIQSQRIGRLAELRRSIVVQSSNLGAITRHICEIIGNPIAVFDASYNLLAIESLGLPVENRVWKTAKSRGNFPPDLVEDFRSIIGSRDISKVPFLCTTHAWTDMHCLVMQLVSKSDRLLGSIAVYEAFRPFTPDDVGIVINAAELLSEYLDSAEFESCRRVSISDLFEELIDGEPLEPEEIAERAEACSWGNYGLYLVGYIRLDDDQAKQRQCEYFRSLIAETSEQVVAVTHRKNIVLLFGGNEQYQLHNLVEDLLPLLTENGLTLGLCSCFRSLGDTRRMYRQAKEALYLGRRFVPSQTICQAIDVSFYSLLQNLSSQQVRRLYETTLYYTIRDYDLKQQTNYCETLVLYFSNMLRSSQTAEKLHMHKNSLLYRLNRISGLFGMNFDNFHDIFNFWLGYKLSVYLDYSEREKTAE